MAASTTHAPSAVRTNQVCWLIAPTFGRWPVESEPAATCVLPLHARENRQILPDDELVPQNAVAANDLGQLSFAPNLHASATGLQLNISRNSELPSFQQRLARGISWSVAGAIVSNGLSFAASLPAAWILGRGGFGELAMVQSTVAMFSAFAGFGIGVAATKSIAECRQQSPKKAARVTVVAVTVSLLTGVVAGAILFAASHWLATTSLAASHLTVPIRIGVLLLILGAVDSVLIGALAGWEDFRAITIVSLAKGICAVPCLAGGAFLGGVEGAIWGSVVISVATITAGGVLVVRKTGLAALAGVNLNNSLVELRMIPQSALPLLISSTVVAVAEWSALALVANQPDGFAETGTFAAINRIVGIVLLMSELLSRPLIPMISEQLGRGARAAAQKTVRVGIRINAAVVAPVILVGALFGSQIMSFFGDDFADSGPILTAALVSAGVVAVSTPMGRWLIASGQAWTNTLVFMIWSLVFVSTAWFMVPWGAAGLVIARGVAYVLRAGILAVVVPGQFLHSDQALEPSVSVTTAASPVLVRRSA